MRLENDFIRVGSSVTHRTASAVFVGLEYYREINEEKIRVDIQARDASFETMSESV